MGRNKSYIDLSVFSCSLSQFLSLVFSSCSEVNCLHKSSLVQKCLLSLAFWIYTLFCFILWNYSSAFAFWTLERFCQLRIVFWSPLLSVYFWSPFCLNFYQILLHLNISWVHLYVWVHRLPVAQGLRVWLSFHWSEFISQLWPWLHGSVYWKLWK